MIWAEGTNAEMHVSSIQNKWCGLLSRSFSTYKVDFLLTNI